MAWGYERGFVIEHDPLLRSKLNCKDCIHYDSTDKSCSKKGLYLPEDGYDSWRKCEFLELSSFIGHYEEKVKQLGRSRSSNSNKYENIGQIKKATTKGHIFLVNTCEVVIPEYLQNVKLKAAKEKRIAAYYSKKQAFQKPILVKKQESGKYELVDGITRLLYAKQKGIVTLPALMDDRYGEKYMSLCLVGCKINHKVKGAGIVTDYHLDSLFVNFNNAEKITQLSLEICIEQDLVQRVYEKK